jgi:magnesium chelatase family protein
MDGNLALNEGGSKPKPGEISLAHNGVLFLDELPEFSRHALDQLREPIEAGHINIVRAESRVTYSSDFQLLAAMNPCKCGYYGDQSNLERCQCPASSIINYKNKISGPLLDRIDLHINLIRMNVGELQSLSKGEVSLRIAERVKEAQYTQVNRQGCLNSKLEGKLLEEHCFLNQPVKNLLIKAETKFNLSVRAYMRVLKVARTIADLNFEMNINQKHLMEALNYRCND